ncbi:MAG: BON domain-containing protein [Reyranella sp.]|nr:BON domain-containing protein [Reyranella sp.]
MDDTSGDTRRVDAQDHLPEVREPAGYRRSDADIAKELGERLADDVGLDARGIEVEVRGGTVRLSGVVRNDADIKRVESHACAIPGVMVVRNDLRCRKPGFADEGNSPAGAASKMGKPSYER